MNLKEKILNDLKKSLKERKDSESLTLRMLQATILNKEKEKRAKLAKEKEGLDEKDLVEKSQLTDDEIIEVAFSEAKKRNESISEFEKGKRFDLVEKERAELEVLKKYLPEQLPEEEIKKLAEGIIDKIGAAGQKDIGKVMAELMPKVKGKAGGGIVSKMVKELLS